MAFRPDRRHPAPSFGHRRLPPLASTDSTSAPVRPIATGTTASSSWDLRLLSVTARPCTSALPARRAKARPLRPILLFRNNLFVTRARHGLQQKLQENNKRSAKDSAAAAGLSCNPSQALRRLPTRGHPRACGGRRSSDRRSRPHSWVCAPRRARGGRSFSSRSARSTVATQVHSHRAAHAITGGGHNCRRRLTYAKSIRGLFVGMARRWLAWRRSRRPAWAGAATGEAFQHASSWQAAPANGRRRALLTRVDFDRADTWSTASRPLGRLASCRRRPD